MKRATLAVVIVAWAMLTGTAVAGFMPPGARVPAASTPDQVEAVEVLPGQVLAAVNQVRRSNGLRDLRLNRALSEAALAHSISMARHGYFDHAGWDGSPFWKRIKASYPPPRAGSWSVGENLVWASPTLSAERAVDLWLKSSEHRRNLLGSSWREIGIGGVHVTAAPGVFDGREVTILTADFGVRSPR